MSYEEYILSEAWQIRRENKLKEEPVCRMCGRNEANQVHHMTYSEAIFPVGKISILGSETPDMLMSVCKKCHKLIHEFPLTYIISKDKSFYYELRCRLNNV